MGLENPLHIAILLIVVLLIFGAKRLPEIGRSLGQGMRSFKNGISGRSDGEMSDLPLRAGVAATEPMDNAGSPDRTQATPSEGSSPERA